MIQEINGNLITLALSGKFDVIGHGCNCFCTMKRGIAPQMAAAFGCDSFPLEDKSMEGVIHKLGNIDAREFSLLEGVPHLRWLKTMPVDLVVANMYTQYHWSTHSRFGVPLDYDALRLCLVKMNHIFKGKHIGLPKVGCGLAGGTWEYVRELIQDLMTDCRVTIVNFEP